MASEYPNPLLHTIKVRACSQRASATAIESTITGVADTYHTKWVKKKMPLDCCWKSRKCLKFFCTLLPLTGWGGGGGQRAFRLCVQVAFGVPYILWKIESNDISSYGDMARQKYSWMTPWWLTWWTKLELRAPSPPPLQLPPTPSPPFSWWHTWRTKLELRPPPPPSGRSHYGSARFELPSCYAIFSSDNF